jgi:glycosyltransferase involved in cell wall biosynthesis
MLVRNTFTHDTRVEKEARTLVDAGYRVTVVADARAGLPERTVTAGAAVRRLARPKAPPGIRFLLGEARLARELVRLRPDILHAHDSNALVPVALAARRLGVPYVYDAHELWLHRPRRGRSRLYEGLFGAWYRLVQRITVPASAAQITVSAPIAAHLARQYGLKDVRLVPNYPEPAPAVRPLPIHALADGRLPPDAPIVLHLGGVMEARGIDELVEAVATCEPAHLVLLGSGPHWSAVADRAGRLGVADRVHLLGPVPSDDVVAYAASATIGVQATVPIGLNNRYSLPNKLFQYMAAGIPVVASDFPQIREVVESAGCGLLVDTTRPEEIAAAIRRMLADPREAREMGARGRAAVAERFNWSSAAATLIGVYRGLVDHPPTSEFPPADLGKGGTMADTHETEP